MSTNIENLPEAEHEKWHRFIDGVNAVMDEVFTTEDRAVLVVGAQWGNMGREDHEDQPVCMVTSNLPVCVTVSAVEDMLAFTKESHEEYHGLSIHSDPESVVQERVPAENVPEDVRQAAIEWAESLGYTADDVQFIEVADASDLRDLPLFEVSAAESETEATEG